MINSAIAENYQSGFGSYSGMANIESKINLSMQYNPLEMQLSRLQPLAEPEDPPETLHTPWGIWLHWRDPLHKIHQRFDAEHVVRTGMAAQDILHYAHYVPVIGEHEHIAESYEMKFEYDYSHELGIYNAEMHLGKEIEESGNAEAINTFADASEEKPLNTETESDEAETPNESNEEPNAKNNESQESDLNLELERELTIIFDKFLMTRVNG